MSEELCPICIQNNCEYFTECNHSYCITCLCRIKKCAICRKELNKFKLCNEIISRFNKKELDILFTINETTLENRQIRLNFNHPIREMVWFIQQPDRLLELQNYY